MKSLYVSDIDGTLARAGYELTEETVAKVRKLVAEGVGFTVATGRFLSRCLGLVEGCDLRCPAIVLSGSLIYDCAAGSILKVWPMEQSVAKKALGILQDLGGNNLCCLYAPGERRCRLCSNEPMEHPYPLDRPNELGFIHDEEWIAADLRPCLEAGQALLLSKAGPSEPLHQAYEALGELPGLSAYLHQSPHRPALWILDVVSDQSGKGTALRWLRDSLGAQETVAFGDNVNDLPLLEAADLSVTVAQAPPSLKAAADLVLPDTVTCVPDFVSQREFGREA